MRTNAFGQQLMPDRTEGEAEALDVRKWADEEFAAPRSPVRILSERKARPSDTDVDAERLDTRVTIYRVRAPSLEVLRQWVKREFPNQHCQHEYDCCAHWYRFYGPYIKRPRRGKRREWIVLDRFDMNI